MKKSLSILLSFALLGSVAIISSVEKRPGIDEQGNARKKQARRKPLADQVAAKDSSSQREQELEQACEANRKKIAQIAKNRSRAVEKNQHIKRLQKDNRTLQSTNAGLEKENSEALEVIEKMDADLDEYERNYNHLVDAHEALMADHGDLRERAAGILVGVFAERDQALQENAVLKKQLSWLQFMAQFAR